MICCSTDLYTHWLLLECVLSGDQTRSLGVLAQQSHRLHYPAQAVSLVSSCYGP